MSCFLSCFGGSKNKRRRRANNRKLNVNRINVNDKCTTLAQNPPSKIIDAKDVQQSICSCPEKVPDEVNVEAADECREKFEIESSPSLKKKVTFDLNVKSYEDIAAYEVLEENLEQKDGLGEYDKVEKSIKEAAFPVNHRYQNCVGSDDENSELGGDEESDCEDCGLSDVDELVGEGNEESYDSFFSLSIDEEKKGSCEAESLEPRCYSDDPDERKTPVVLAKSNARDRSQYVHSVLNPVENLTQWKEVKMRTAAPVKDLNKENVESEVKNKVSLGSEPIIVKTKKPEWSVNSKPSPRYTAKSDVSVDASLSTWLVSSDSSTVEGPQESYSRLSNSSMSREEQPILGALTLEDIKQASATSTPRRSPSKSPDETPIIGTVGSYWNSKMQRDDDSVSSRKSGCRVKGIPNTTSKYREDQRVNWHSTPFEVRLERALNKGTA